MKYVSKPNLPSNTDTILLGEKYYNKLKKAIENLGLRAIKIPDNPYVDERLSGHADLSVVHMGENLLALAPYMKDSAFADKMEREGFKLSYANTAQAPNYPMDAAMNVCICGDKLIYNPKTADENIVQYLTKERGLATVAVKQGYSRCSVCVLNDRAIITSDELIHKRAEDAGISSLKILPGYFLLNGFDYGFIGGSSFKISDSKLAFTGNLDYHPNKEDIIKFASLHNIDLVYITENPAFDIGSAIPVTEK